MSSRPPPIVFGIWILMLWVSCNAANAPSQEKSAGKAAATSAPHKKEAARMIDWDALLPDSERASYNSEPPAPVHDYLGEGGRAARQAGSIAVNKKLSETQVKIPGFIVPLVIDQSGL